MFKITGYQIVNLNDTINTTAEERIDEILSSYSCPLNRDVEYFLKNKAKEFSKQRIASTYLIFTSYQDEPVFIGYFSIAQKTMFISRKNIPSESFKRRINKFGEYNPDLKGYVLSLQLIAQLGKNYTNDYNKLISGDELLEIACEQVAEIQALSSGKFTYIECEDKEPLIRFYTDNGFRKIANREISKGEVGTVESSYLVQMIKYIK